MVDAQVRIPADGVSLVGDLSVPDGATGVVVFAHGSGSSRLSPRNMQVAHYLRSTGGFGTLLFDLLTEHEDATYQTRFDIELLAGRLEAATSWLRDQDGMADLAVAYFGASTGAAAALVAAAHRDDIAAVVSRGGRPDLAGGQLSKVRAPTLLIVGALDTQVIAMNEDAMSHITAPVEMITVPGATHLFEEPGTLEEVAHLARGWFERYLP